MKYVGERCIQESQGGCEGPVEYRMPIYDHGYGKSFPRCEKHWDERLKKEDEIRRRYPEQQPADFDPSYAGERWNEDD
jgi:hypothetical protein